MLFPSTTLYRAGFLSADDSAIGLRFCVQLTVCSGWGYLPDLAREQRDGDTVFEQDGVRIFADADSLALVDGTRIDFLQQRLNEQFVFENPNVAADCGCGERFTTDTDRAASFDANPPHPDRQSDWLGQRGEIIAKH